MNPPNKKSMAGGDDKDMFSKLADLLLIQIISFLPFKEAVRTSVLSKRWRHIWHETKNVEFNESFFVDFSEDEQNRIEKRNQLMGFTRDWTSRFPGNEIHNLALTFSKPENFHQEILSLLNFSVSRNVKHLFLDFSDPTRRDEDPANHPIAFELPSFIFQHRGLQSLKLYACRFLVSGFENLNSLKDLSLGWIQLSVASLNFIFEKCPLLESLTLTKCWDLNHLEICGMNLPLMKLVVDKCDVINMWFHLDAPNLKVFKYSGKVLHFDFDSVNSMIKEADLDFGPETEFSEIGLLLYNLLQDLTSARTLTVCSYLLQVIPSGEEPLRMQCPLEARHLILNASLHPNEFWGLKFMLNSCPKLHSLTIQMTPPRALLDYSPPYPFEPSDFWTEKAFSYRCLEMTLRVVGVTGFKGAREELVFLQYLLLRGRVMKHLDIHISREMGDEERKEAVKGSQMVQQFKRASKNLHITIYR